MHNNNWYLETATGVTHTRHIVPGTKRPDYHRTTPFSQYDPLDSLRKLIASKKSRKNHASF